MHETEPDEKLFTTWWRDHRGIFVKVARSFAPQPADEADLIQEMLVQLWRSLPRFRAQSRPSTWIYQVCLHTAMTWKRTETRRRQRVDTSAGPVDAFPAEGAATGRADEEKLAALYAAIRRLSPADRSLVLLLLDGLSYREIGEVTGLSENRVGVALTRARAKMADLIMEVRNELG